ncbi:MAG: DUF1453 family protein [Alphaproteobacteria bacterium]|nr:DUF1453 family protein [Alphaproteobacteria bacterium]
MGFKDIAPFIAPLIVVALVTRRMMAQAKPQRVRPNSLWVRPAVIALLMALALWTSPRPGLLGIALFVAAAAIGAVAGYFRALHQEFSIEPETGYVMSKASPIGSMIFLGVFMVRFALNYWMNGGAARDMSHPPSPELLTYTDAMLFFAFALVAATAWETWRRTRPLVAEHRAQTPPQAGRPL